jgi:hypothetical protein
MKRLLLGIATAMILGLGVLVFLLGDADDDTIGSARGLQASQPFTFSGKVLSAAGVGGDAFNSGHPVVGATVYLVPTTAMDLSTKMTASAIYAAPYPAEVYDEPLEDAIRLKGKEFPQAMTDAEGNFRIEAMPDGNFFVHVTPATDDTEHLPGGDHSRNAYSAQQLSSEAMNIEVLVLCKTGLTRHKTRGHSDR